MNWLFGYYVICLVYCFYQLNVKYKTRGIEYASPELDAVMVMVMAWLLAPVDVSITWIRMVKKALERLKTYQPNWPVPKIFRLAEDKKVLEGVFEGEG